jgi:hypothetical protein
LEEGEDIAVAATNEHPMERRPDAANDDDDATEEEGMPIAVGLLSWFRTESVMKLYQARQASYLMIVGGVLGNAFALVVLGVAIALGLPPWPTSVYSYGYTLNAINWFSGILALIAATKRGDELVLATAVILSLQMLVNVLVAVLQIVGGISTLVNLNTTPNLFGVITSLILVVLTAVTLTGAWVLYDLILKFRPKLPTFGRRRQFVRR